MLECAGLHIHQEAASGDHSPGSRLDRYEILSLLGAGGMGEVYKAQDTTELERVVAIKVLPSEIAADKERMRHFIQEAKTASSLNHPNILTIFEIGEASGMRFIATEFIDGETLRQHMSRARLTLHEALHIAIQVSPRHIRQALCIATSSRRTSCCGAMAT